MLKVPMQEKLIQNMFSQVEKMQFPAGRPCDIYVRRIVILINSLKHQRFKKCVPEGKVHLASLSITCVPAYPADGCV